LAERLCQGKNMQEFGGKNPKNENIWKINAYVGG
jgi:hypothetical protein